MASLRLDDLPPGPFRDRVLAALEADDRARAAANPGAVVAAGERMVATVAAGQEARLQADCERWLAWRGYWRRTPNDIAAGPPPLGWQVHLSAPKGNPLLLDVLLLDNGGRWLEIELKTSAGRLARHQAQLIEQDESRRHLCRSLPEVRAVVHAWEAADNAQHAQHS